MSWLLYIYQIIRVLTRRTLMSITHASHQSFIVHFPIHWNHTIPKHSWKIKSFSCQSTVFIDFIKLNLILMIMWKKHCQQNYMRIICSWMRESEGQSRDNELRPHRGDRQSTSWPAFCYHGNLHQLHVRSHFMYFHGLFYFLWT